MIISNFLAISMGTSDFTRYFFVLTFSTLIQDARGAPDPHTYIIPSRVVSSYIIQNTQDCFTSQCMMNNGGALPQGLMPEDDPYFDPNFQGPRSVVLSSEGLAAEYRSKWLGVYNYDFKERAYKQANTETDIEQYEPKYIHKCSGDGEWYVSNAENKKSGCRGYLWNGEKSETIPLNGWKIWFNDQWSSDATLEVSTKVPVPCDDIKIYAFGPAAKLRLERLGKFELTKKMWNGHQVYENEEGTFLHIVDDNGWGVSSDLGFYGIRSLQGYQCPSSSKEWQYWDEEPKPADIVVTSSKHQIMEI